MSIAVIAGLGNPGARYDGTRHNIGFVLVDALAQRHGCSWSRSRRYNAAWTRCRIAEQAIHLIKPLTFMNESGRCLGPFCRFHRFEPQRLLVVYDDITLDTARVKLSTRGSAGGHNGIASVQQHFGDDFARYRVGIGAKAHPQMDLKDHVLSRFTSSEQAVIDARLSDYVEDLERIVAEGVATAMNYINQRKRYHESDSHP